SVRSLSSVIHSAPSAQWIWTEAASAMEWMPRRAISIVSAGMGFSGGIRGWNQYIQPAASGQTPLPNPFPSPHESQKTPAMPHVPIARQELPALDLLRSFEAAARHLSFTLAAQELFLTQSAVSRQIQQVEVSLGVPLFERRHRALALTEAGLVMQRAVV